MTASTALRVLVAGLAIALVSSAAYADEEPNLVAIYGWLSGIDGDVTVRGVSVPVDESFSDLAENLDGAAMLHYESRQGRWLLLADLILVSVADERRAFEVGLDQSIAEVLAGYRVSEVFEVLFGARYVSLEPRIAFSGPQSRRVEQDKDWLDPVLGGRFRADLGERWQLIARGDLGGFGVGSELTWNVAVNALYRASRHTSLVMGYRRLDIDYEQGSAGERFVYDVATSGPQLGIAFHF